jgi:hypothetical protein
MYNEQLIEKINKRIEDIIKKQLYKKYPYGVKYKGRGPKVASKTLVNSIKSNFEPSKMDFEISMEDYGKYVDQGRKAGKYVPIEPLMKWIKDKGIKGRDKKGKFISTESLAFAISASKKKFNIRPTNFIKTSDELILTDKALIELFELLIVDKIESEIE